MNSEGHSAGKQIRLLLLLCISLLALGLLYQSTQIRQQLTKQRLLEVSIQDLIAQSTALRHLDHLQNYQSKLDLESQGYGSPQELVNQLAARLAVLEAINQAGELAEHTAKLREHLIAIDQAINSAPGRVSPAIDSWYNALNPLNSATVTQHVTSNKQINSLNHINLILALMTSSIGIFYAGQLAWSQSSLRSKINSKLLGIGTENRIDPLTDLPNSKGWEELCNKHLRSSGQQANFAGNLAVINIDYFDQFCDTYGQSAGEVRVCELAERLKTNFRPSDLIGRIGEHEFAVLLPNCTSEDARRIVERMRTAEGSKVDFSAGICDIEQSQSVEHTMAMADQAMYESRRKKKAQS